MRHPSRLIADRVGKAAGGPARARVVLLLACVLALDTADISTIGAVAGQLERGLAISNAELGLLVSIPSLVGALATLPMGILTDRVRRVRLLAVSVVIWTAAMAASGIAVSFVMLLVTRIALGAVTATAGPTLSSLVGDYFPGRERARIYGLILSGELAGAGLGFLLSSEAAAAFSWRAAFVILALPSLALSIALWRGLREPARGGASRLEPAAGKDGATQRRIRERAVRPHEHLVLERDPAQLSLRTAFGYVLRVRTNVILIITSALGYFYFAGVQTFALVYFRGHYGIWGPLRRRYRP